MISSRRSFLTNLGATLITAPAIVRATNLMSVNALLQPRKLLIYAAGQSNFFYYNGSEVLSFRGETDPEWTPGVYADRVERVIAANAEHRWFTATQAHAT